MTNIRTQKRTKRTCHFCPYYPYFGPLRPYYCPSYKFILFVIICVLFVRIFVLVLILQKGCSTSDTPPG